MYHTAILTETYDPPQSKRALKRALAEDARGVLICEGDSYEFRSADELAEGESVEVVGPEPQDIRFTAEVSRYYGRIVVR